MLRTHFFVRSIDRSSTAQEAPAHMATTSAWLRPHHGRRIMWLIGMPAGLLLIARYGAAVAAVPGSGSGAGSGVGRGADAGAGGGADTDALAGHVGRAAVPSIAQAAVGGRGVPDP